jgi:hypothetical protein
VADPAQLAQALSGYPQASMAGADPQALAQALQTYQPPVLNDGRADMTGQYNTQLAPDQEAAFRDWAQKNNRQSDLADYDLRGWFASNGSQAANGHFTDQFKKPNHPTFSDQSQYSGAGGNQGGTWGGNDSAPTFTPSATNLKNMSADALQGYFQRVEPGSKLLLPTLQN